MLSAAFEARLGAKRDLFGSWTFPWGGGTRFGGKQTSVWLKKQSLQCGF